MVRTGTIDFTRAVFDTTPDIARADYNADLDTFIHTALDNRRKMIEYIEVKTGTLYTG